MFPHLKAQFNGGRGLDDIAAKLELLLAQKTTGGYLMQSAAAPKFELPKFEDDEELPTIVTTGISATDAGGNLVSALKGLYN